MRTITSRISLTLALGVLLAVGASCKQPPGPQTTQTDKPCPTCPTAPSGQSTPRARPSVGTPQGPATVAEATKFLAAVNKDLLALWIKQERMRWVQATNLTHDTEILVAKVDEEVMEFIGRKAMEANRFDKVKLPAAMRRQLRLIKLAQTLPAPADAKERAELATKTAKMKSIYGKGTYCWKTPRPGKKKCLSLGDMYKVLAKSRKPAELLEVWTGWRKISLPMRKIFERYVELGNKGAQSLGFKDLGGVWRSNYDMTPAAFEKEMDRLWLQVRPLYKDLHCHVRAKLMAKYGKAIVPEKGPLPAHLLGNMWGQEWTNIFDLVKPQLGRGIDLDRVLKAKRTDPLGMVRYAEAFFVSLGLEKLPKTFWKRSMFTKPRDRDVVCHASAWDIDFKDDLRIKMCIAINTEDFVTIHHELGHNYYQRAYNQLPTLFQNSANDGFHEALGDVIALSVTAPYLKKVGLIAAVPPLNLNPMMRKALEKIAFLPFGLLMDKWRWGVFSGRVKPSEYNSAWWKLRLKYQGIAPATPRGEEHFDPGAKYHIPANVPYARYFLAAILQFQFHRALCKIAGHKGPLSTCSIYNNKEAGRRLNAMMKMGLSKPWPEALKALTGETRMDASAILDYFKPLHDWLKKQNKGRTCGW